MIRTASVSTTRFGRPGKRWCLTYHSHSQACRHCRGYCRPATTDTAQASRQDWSRKRQRPRPSTAGGMRQAARSDRRLIIEAAATFAPTRGTTDLHICRVPAGRSRSQMQVLVTTATTSDQAAVGLPPVFLAILILHRQERAYRRERLVRFTAMTANATATDVLVLDAELPTGQLP